MPLGARCVLEKVSFLLKEKQSLMSEVFLSEHDTWNYSSHFAETWGKFIKDGRMEKQKVPGSLWTQSCCYMNLPCSHPTSELPAIPDRNAFCAQSSLHQWLLTDLQYPVILTKEKTFHFLLLGYHLFYSYSEHDKMPFPSLAGTSSPQGKEHIILFQVS